MFQEALYLLTFCSRACFFKNNSNSSNKTHRNTFTSCLFLFVICMAASDGKIQLAASKEREREIVREKEERRRLCICLLSAVEPASLKTTAIPATKYIETLLHHVCFCLLFAWQYMPERYSLLLQERERGKKDYCWCWRCLCYSMPCGCWLSDRSTRCWPWIPSLPLASTASASTTLASDVTQAPGKEWKKVGSLE